MGWWCCSTVLLSPNPFFNQAPLGVFDCADACLWTSHLSPVTGLTGIMSFINCWSIFHWIPDQKADYYGSVLHSIQQCLSCQIKMIYLLWGRVPSRTSMRTWKRKHWFTAENQKQHETTEFQESGGGGGGGVKGSSGLGCLSFSICVGRAQGDHPLQHKPSLRTKAGKRKVFCHHGRIHRCFKGLSHPTHSTSLHSEEWCQQTVLEAEPPKEQHFTLISASL